MVDHRQHPRPLARRARRGWSRALLPAVVALALLAEPARAEPPAPTVDPASTLVELESRPVVRFTAAIGHVSAVDRARQARERLEALPIDAAWQPVTVKPYQLGEQQGHAVLVGDMPVLTVVEGDLDPARNETTASLASAAASRLAEALRARHDQRSLPFLLRAIGASAAATAILAFLLWGLAWMRRRASGAVAGIAQSHGGFLARKGLDPRPLIASGARGLLRLLYWLLAVTLLDLWLTYVLRRFPATAPWADALTGRVLGILGDLGLEALKALPGLVGVAIIVAVARALSVFLSGVFDRVASGTLTFPGLHPETVGATRRIAQAFLWMAALAAAYPYLPGSSSEAFKGLSILLGVMVSLGSTGIMAQAMSGLVVVYSRALEVGDSIRAGEVEGVVTEVGLLSTKVVTLRGQEVTLPNNVVIAGGVTNFSRLNRGRGGALCTTTVTIGYDAPWRQVEAMLIRAASETPGMLAEVPPYVLQRSLSDFFVTYDLVARLENPVDRPQVLSELHGRIQDLFNEAGIQIMSPHYMVQPPAPVLARPAGAGPDRPPRAPPVSG